MALNVESLSNHEKTVLLARLANERFTLFILVSTGSFANEHELGVNIPNSENHVFSGSDQIGALGARQRSLTKLGKRLELGLWAQAVNG